MIFDNIGGFKVICNKFGIIVAAYRIDLPFPFNCPIEVSNPRGKTWTMLQAAVLVAIK